MLVFPFGCCCFVTAAWPMLAVRNNLTYKKKLPINILFFAGGGLLLWCFFYSSIKSARYVRLNLYPSGAGVVILLFDNDFVQVCARYLYLFFWEGGVLLWYFFSSLLPTGQQFYFTRTFSLGRRCSDVCLDNSITPSNPFTLFTLPSPYGGGVVAGCCSDVTIFTLVIGILFIVAQNMMLSLALLTPLFPMTMPSAVCPLFRLLNPPSAYLTDLPSP